MKEHEIEITATFSLAAGYSDCSDYPGLSDEDKKAIEQELKSMIYDKYKKVVKTRLDSMHNKEHFVTTSTPEYTNIEMKEIKKWR